MGCKLTGELGLGVCRGEGAEEEAGEGVGWPVQGVQEKLCESWPQHPFPWVAGCAEEPGSGSHTGVAKGDFSAISLMLLEMQA